MLGCSGDATNSSSVRDVVVFGLYECICRQPSLSRVSMQSMQGAILLIIIIIIINRHFKTLN